MASYADKTLKCIECGSDFTYLASEQELHASLGYQNEPKRCTPCRDAKRQRKGGGAPRAGGSPPANGSRSGGHGQPREGGGGGGNRENRGTQTPRDQGGRERREGGGAQTGGGGREYFLAICNECGAEAQLPFKPRGDRPVFCSDCFLKKKAASS